MRKGVLFIYYIVCSVGWARGQSNAQELLHTGDVYFLKDSLMRAGQLYTQAMDADPKSSIAPYNAGVVAQKLGNTQLAVEAYQRSLENDNKHPETAPNAWHNLGNAAFEEQKYADAVKYYKQSLKLRPGHAQTQKNLEIARRRLQNQQHQKEVTQRPQPQNNQPQPQDQQPQQDAAKTQKQMNPNHMLDLLEQEEQKVQRKLQKGEKNPVNSSKKRW